MGYEELIASLRTEGDEKVKAIRAKAETAAAQIRAETARQAEQMRARYREQEMRQTEVQEADVLLPVRRQGYAAQLEAEEVLSAHLFSIAKALLPELRDDHYPDVFASLVTELPDADWEEVRVNPNDTDMVRAHFPHARIIHDDAISGGIEVSGEDGKIQVINTFEKRLERIWDEIIPEIMKDVKNKT